ncbi:hypothetical protein MTO96_018044 [Rhipicephalus appendiculatus]
MLQAETEPFSKRLRVQGARVDETASRLLRVDPLATQSAGEDEIVVDSVWVAASLKAHGYEAIVDGGESLSSSCDTGQESYAADGSLSSLLGSSSETCLAGEPRKSTPASSEPCHASGSRASSGTTCTDNVDLLSHHAVDARTIGVPAEPVWIQVLF